MISGCFMAGMFLRTNFTHRLWILTTFAIPVSFCWFVFKGARHTKFLSSMFGLFPANKDKNGWKKNLAILPCIGIYKKKPLHWIVYFLWTSLQFVGYLNIYFKNKIVHTCISLIFIDYFCSLCIHFRLLRNEGLPSW